jgi:hypothetical protein
MSYLEQWRAISARIDGTGRAADFYSRLPGQESYKSYREIGIACKNTLALIKQLVCDYDSTLPAAAKSRITEFMMEKHVGVFDGAEDWTKGRSAVVMLLSLKVELDYLLSDQQEHIRSRAERAFLHLQRVLAVDATVREQWKAALNGQGETACEQLGAVHLLQHGIFAFKVNSTGARTDLVFADMRDDFGSRGLDGLVLTEWKVGNDASADTKFAEAREQMKLYRRSALAGPELTAVRYAIVVSPTDLAIAPRDHEEHGLLYRQINISIDPKTPSAQARRLKKSG